MKIKLSEISKEGSEWFLSRGEEPEIDQALQDIIGDKEPYQVVLEITPLDQLGSYQMVGHYKTQWIESCSRCADDFKFAVKQDFQEILIPKLEMPRKGSTSKTQTPAETEVSLNFSAYEYEEDVFNLGDYLHEVITLARPLAPSPELNEKGACVQCHKTPEQLKPLWGQEEASFKPPSPFEVLKTIKQ